ncbi:MAG: methyl-accepting chemotaxis protein [Chromatiales bacterium]|nr:methyl-accepting chemotaxis protein [Chromatiales bacterium]
MGRLSIKEKMSLLALLVATGLVMMMVLNYFSVSSLSNLEEIRLNSMALETVMLMLRRHEKDFIARKDPKYIVQFKQTFLQMDNRLAKTEEQLQEAGIEMPEIVPLKEIIQKYSQKFGELAEQQKKIGLNPKDGLYGSLRDKVHSIEALIKGYEKEHGASQQSHSLMRTMLMLRRHEKDFMLRRDLKYMGKFNKRIETMQNKLMASGLGADFISQSTTALEGYKTDFLALVKGEERFGLTSKQGILGEMRQVIHQSETQLSELSKHMTLLTEEYIRDKKITNISVGLMMTLLVMGLLTMISKGVVSRIKTLSTMMSTARNDMDLSVRAEVTGGDEIASMASVYNEMMEEFEGVMREVYSSSIDLAAAADQLANSTSATADGVARQLVESEQVATAMNEMSATVNEVAGNASRAAEASAIANETSNKGRERVEENRNSFTQLAASIESSGTIIESLSEESNNIGAMLNVIRGIAEQTNLLALNAAIEAARAGEQGRGFAVVADEVRTLAQRSAQSTQDIEDVVNRLQDLASDAVSAMSQGRVQAEQSVENATNVGRALSEINEAISTVDGMNIQIATAAEEQSHVSEEINRSVVSITDIARDTSQSAEIIAAAGTQLHSLSEQLGERVSRFKLS